MFRYYFKIALRNIKRFRIYSTLNIVGLATGIAAAILAIIYVSNELGYEQSHSKAGQIYRMVTRDVSANDGSGGPGIAKIPGPYGPAAVEEIPGVIEMTRLSIIGNKLISVGDIKYYESEGLHADGTVFDIFDYDFIFGEKANALTEPNQVVLTASLSEKYFGTDNPIGLSITFDINDDYLVTGVIADPPAQSHFSFSYLVSMKTGPATPIDDWNWSQFYTYLLLSDDFSPKIVEESFVAILVSHMGEEDSRGIEIILQALPSIHLNSNLFRELSTNSSLSSVAMFGLIATFILLLASINFINLSTAMATKRAKEVGVRKATGARRSDLMTQYITEAVVVSFMSLILALIMVELVMPSFNNITGKNLGFNYFENINLMLGILSLTIIVGMISGSYPAIVLSQFDPIHALKGESQRFGGARLRRFLVVIQFAISIALIAATTTVFKQMNYINRMAIGFDKEHIVVVPIRDDQLRVNHAALKAELQNYPDIIFASVSANVPGGSDYGIPIEPEGLPPGETAPIRHLIGDPDFIDTYGMEIVSGRKLSMSNPSDLTNAYIINQEAARQFGWTDPIGKRIDIPAVERTGTIVGVVKDFNFRSVHDPIAPLLLYNPPGRWNTRISIKVETDDMQSVIAYIEKTFNNFDSSHPFSYTFFDEAYDGLYKQEEQEQKILGYFSAIAIFIATLGLFGLATFAAERRTKEIGVRKVLGATTRGIVAMLSAEFVQLAVIANLIAWPIAWWSMSRWLEGFAYRITLSPSLFVFAGLVALIIAFATVSVQALKAASANPIDALRYE